MDVKDAITRLKHSELFLKWKKDNQNAYLANCFMMIDVQVVPEWQIGYYDKDSDRITTFAVGEKITKNPESEVFKKENIIEPLDMSKVEISSQDALDKATRWQKGKYPGNAPVKKIILLQNLDGSHIYNITFITESFKTLNIKVSSEEGHIVSDKLSSIMDFSMK